MLGSLSRDPPPDPICLQQGSTNFTNSYSPVSERGKLGLGEVNCPRLHTQCQSKDLNPSRSEPRACVASHQLDSGPRQQHLQVPPTPKNPQIVASTTAELFSIQGHHWLISHWVPRHMPAMTQLTFSFSLGEVERKASFSCSSITAVWGDTGERPTTKEGGLGCQ